MKLSDYEIDIINKGKTLIGIDEAGRGSIFGPMALGVVFIDKVIEDKRVKDSKRLLPNTRKNIFNDWINTVDNNVLFSFPENGLNEAYEECFNNIVDKIKSKKNYVIITDNGIKRFFKLPNVEEHIKAEDKYFCVALASIMAKVSRDKLIENLSLQKKYSMYDLKENKGYTSDTHMEAIRIYGITDLHRSWYKNIKAIIQPYEFDDIIE